MLYVPTNNLETAKLISKSFYELSRPQSVRSPEDTTQYYCAWLIHPQTEVVILEIPDISLYIHSEADKTIFDKFIQRLVANKEISELEITKTQELIDSSRGLSVNIENIIPSFWKEQAKTHEELEKEGWFDNPNKPRRKA